MLWERTHLFDSKSIEFTPSSSNPKQRASEMHGRPCDPNTFHKVVSNKLKNIWETLSGERILGFPSHYPFLQGGLQRATLRNITNFGTPLFV